MNGYWIQRNQVTDALDINLKAPGGSLKIINENGSLFEIDYLGNTVYNKPSCIKYGEKSMCLGDKSLDINGSVVMNGPVMLKNKIGFAGNNNTGIEYSNKSLNMYAPEKETINFQNGKTRTMSLSANRLNISGNIVADEGTFGKINITELDNLYIKNGVKVDPLTYGPMIEANKSPTNRFGIGNYDKGKLRVYASALNNESSINLGFAQGTNTWDDRITIQNDKNIKINGNVNIVNGTLKMGAYSFEIDQPSGNLNLVRNGKVIKQF